MDDKKKGKTPEEKMLKEQAIKGQSLFDNYWLWFALSILLSGVIYNVWGLLELWLLESR